MTMVGGSHCVLLKYLKVSSFPPGVVTGKAPSSCQDGTLFVFDVKRKDRVSKRDKDRKT